MLDLVFLKDLDKELTGRFGFSFGYWSDWNRRFFGYWTIAFDQSTSATKIARLTKPDNCRFALFYVYGIYLNLRSLLKCGTEDYGAPSRTITEYLYN